ncbi:MAG: hypothetical protein LAP13_00815 [Acidobacteriia bacterium]|nr:hypothetical protein [Terriglobia bacterium]
MRKLVATLGLLLLVPAMAPAQEAEHPSRGQGYVFLAPIVSNARYVFSPACYGVVFPPGQPPPADCFSHKRGGVNAGFGGEVFVYRGLGVGTEFGYAGQDWSFGSNGIGVGSVNGSYHFSRQKKAEPFVTGGYSLYFGDRTAVQNGYNLGGGANLWVSKHAALRLEVRNQGNINQFHSQFTQFVAFRVGMTFR